MYQFIGIVNWHDQTARDQGHRTMTERVLDRFEELAPPGAQAFITQCSDTQTLFTALYPSAEGVENDPKRQLVRKVVRTVIKDLLSEKGVVFLEGTVVASRVVD